MSESAFIGLWLLGLTLFGVAAIASIALAYGS